MAESTLRGQCHSAGPVAAVWPSHSGAIRRPPVKVTIRRSHSVHARVLSGGALLAAITAITSCFNVLILAAIGRELGPAAVGLFGVGSALGAYISVLGAFGTTQILTREVAQGDEECGRDFLALLLGRAVFVLVSALLAILSTSLVTALIITNVTATLLVDLAMAVRYGKGESVTAGITLGAYRGAGLIAIPVLILSHSLTAVAAALVAATVVVGGFALVGVRQRLCFSGEAREPFIKLVARALSLWRRGASLAAWAGLDAAISRGDVAIVGLLATTFATGQYVAGATMMMGVASTGMAITNVLLPELARQDERHARQTLQRLLAVMLPVLLIVGLALAVLAPSVVSLLYGTRGDYGDTAVVFRMLVLFLPVVVGGRCLQVGLVARGRDRAVLVTQLLGTATMIVGCTIGYLTAGIKGVAVGTGLAYVVIAASGLVATEWRSDRRQDVSHLFGQKEVDR